VDGCNRNGGFFPACTKANCAVSHSLIRLPSRQPDPTSLVEVVKQVSMLIRPASGLYDPTSLVEVVKQVRVLIRPFRA
jgi:hypothetical protein